MALRLSARVSGDGWSRAIRCVEEGRVRSEEGAERRRTLYSKLLETGGRVAAQARRLAREVQDGVKRSADPLDDALLRSLRKELETIVERVEQVGRQTRQRIFGGDVHAPDKLLRVFEPATEVIRKARRASRTNLARWSRSKKRRIRS